MISLYSIVRKPIITEKASKLLGQFQVTFEVRKNANKYQIKEAIKTLFDIDVLSIKTMIVRGKVKRLGKKYGKRKNIKKAIVCVDKNADINKLGIITDEQ